MSDRNQLGKLTRRSFLGAAGSWAFVHNFIPSAFARHGRAGGTPGAPPAAGTWAARSTGPGVLWSHDFTSSVSGSSPGVLELNYFWKYIDATQQPNNGYNTNPSAGVLATLPNPLTIAATSLPGTSGPSNAIVSQLIGTQVTAYWNGSSLASPGSSSTTIPAGITNGQPGWPTTQIWGVSSTTGFKDPAVIGNYQAFVGQPQQSGQQGAEAITIKGIDFVNNRILLTRASQNSSGIYPIGQAPSYDLTMLQLNLGFGPSGYWIRPFGCFRGTQNGKGIDDPAAGGTLPNPNSPVYRSWSTATDAQTHNQFREGFWGSPQYWNPMVGPATYANWTPQDEPGNTRNNAWDGTELWLQYRVLISQSRFAPGTLPGKMTYVQETTGGDCCQTFRTMGAQGSLSGGITEELPLPLQQGVGATGFGAYQSETICFGDSRAPAGGILLANGVQTNNAVGFQLDDDASGSVLVTHAPFNAWCFPTDVYVTYLEHFIWAVDNAFPTADNLSFYLVVTGATGNYTLGETVYQGATLGTATASGKVVLWNASTGQLVVDPSSGSWATSVAVKGNSSGITGNASQASGEPLAPWSSASQYLMTKETYVAMPGASSWFKILDVAKGAGTFRGFFGEGANWGYYYYNPPGVTSFQGTEYPNIYLGSGSKSPPSINTTSAITQIIASTQTIPLPVDTAPWIAGMVPYQCEPIMSVSNGNATMASVIPSDWNPNAAFGGIYARLNSSIVDTWSGAAENRNRKQLILNGAGHNDSPNPAVILYDASGYSEPGGYSLVGITTVANMPNTPSQTNNFTASISGSTLTVSAISVGSIIPGQTITGTGVSTALSSDAAGNQVLGTVILSQLSGTAGGVGTYSVSISQTVASEAMSSGVSHYVSLADGRWPADHTYDLLAVDEKTNTLYRYGGAPYQAGGTDAVIWSVNLSTGVYTNLGTSPVNNSNGYGTVIKDEVARKVLLMRNGSSSGGAFHRWDGNTWSGVKSTPNVGQDITSAYDFIRKRAIWAGTFSGTQYLELVTIDFFNETLTNSTFTPTGATEILNYEGLSMFYDQERDSFWMFAPGTDSGPETALFGFIYEMSASTFNIVKTALTGTIYNTTSAYQGGYHKFLFMPESRAIVLVANESDYAYVIKLPS